MGRIRFYGLLAIVAAVILAASTYRGVATREQRVRSVTSRPIELTPEQEAAARRVAAREAEKRADPARSAVAATSPTQQP
jgi:hypothetical protein